VASVISGKGGSLNLGGLEVEVDEWHVDDTVDDIKDTSTSAMGRTRHTAGFATTKMSFKGYWDPLNNPHDPAGRKLRSGNKLDNVVFSLIRADPVYRYQARTALVESVSVSDVAAGRAEIEISLVVDGALAYPGDATIP